MVSYFDLYLGVDPGVGGAIAGIVVRDGVVEEVRFCDMPCDTTGKGKRRVNPGEVHRTVCGWIDSLTPVRVQAFVEQVGAMPGQGVSSMFSFGDAFGCVRGVVGCLAVPVVYVTPAKWKRDLTLTGKDKDYARTRAKELYAVSKWLARKKDVGRADALLIAHWGRRFNC